jgi:hypothetical protein
MKHDIPWVTANMDFKEYGLEVNVKKSRSSYFVTKMWDKIVT